MKDNSYPCSMLCTLHCNHFLSVATRLHTSCIGTLHTFAIISAVSLKFLQLVTPATTRRGDFVGLERISDSVRHHYLSWPKTRQQGGCQCCDPCSCRVKCHSELCATGRVRMRARDIHKHQACWREYLVLHFLQFLIDHCHIFQIFNKLLKQQYIAHYLTQKRFLKALLTYLRNHCSISKGEKLCINFRHFSPCCFAQVLALPRSLRC